MSQVFLAHAARIETVKLILSSIWAQLRRLRINNVVVVSVSEANLAESSCFAELVSLFGLGRVERSFQHGFNVNFGNGKCLLRHKFIL